MGFVLYASPVAIERGDRTAACRIILAFELLPRLCHTGARGLGDEQFGMLGLFDRQEPANIDEVLRIECCRAQGQPVVEVAHGPVVAFLV